MTKLTGYTRSPLALALAAALFLPMSSLALAQSDDSQDDEDKDSQKLEEIVVVGSRIKRAEVEGPAPVTVITREDIDREGFQTVGDVLQSLNQNTTASFTGELATAGFTPNAQVVNLRNLGPGYTLTLINGRRPAQYPQPYNRDNNVVNLRAIPSAMIERIEVLAGGASAIYGSDAIAGVVNIVTRTNFDGHQIRATVGTTADGGGDAGNFEFTGGSTGDRWSAVYGVQAGYEEPIFADQRDFLSDLREGPRGPDFTNPALSLIVIRGSTPNAAQLPLNQNAYYPGEEACNAFGYTTRTTATRGHYCGSFDQVATRSIQNKGENFSAYGYGTFDLTDTVQLYGQVSYFDTHNTASNGTEFWGTSGDQFTRNRADVASPLYYDPQFGHLVQLQRIFNGFELGGPEAASTQFDEKAYEFMAGAGGVLFDDFDWDFFISHGRYEYEQDRPRLLAQAVHNYFLGTQEGFAGPLGQDGGNFPVYTLDLDRWSTPITPEIYRSFSTRVLNLAETESSTINFNMSGDLFELPAGPVGFAGVLEGNRQSTDLRSDPRTDPLRPRDDQTIYNLVSSGRTEGERDRYAAGVEFRVPIFSMLTAQVAGRYDSYDDISQVDDAFTYMAGLEFRPFDSLLLRGSYATSFRAPDMQLVYAEGAASFANITDEYACRSGTSTGAAGGPRSFAQCNVSGDPTIYSAQTRVAGNPNLKEEEGESYTYGFVWDIIDNMSFSADFWRIKLEDAASQLTNARLLRDEANCRLGVDRAGNPFQFDINSSFCQNILSLIQRIDAPGTNQDGRVQSINSAYINTALTDTSGIDATFRYGWETDRFGTFRLDLGYSVVLTNKQKQFYDDDLVDYRDDPTDINQRSRTRGSISWEKGDWTTTVFGVRYGSNGTFAAQEGCDTVAGGNPNLCWGERLQPYMVYNLSIRKVWTENLNTTLAVENVLDNQYRYDPSQVSYPFFQYYLGADPAGRRFYLTAEYKF
jgi:iron complex outermembrane receptor protein